MNLNKEVCMVTKSKFKEIKEELNRNYYNTNVSSLANNSYDCRFNALKNAVDDLLTLLDKAVCQEV